MARTWMADCEPSITQDTTWESDKNSIKHHIQELQEVSPHKAARYRKDSMLDNYERPITAPWNGQYEIYWRD